MTYWQVAAGEGSRNYTNLFLEYGVILVGTGNPGSYLKFPEKYRGRKDWRRKIVTLADKVKQGDVVILKRGARRDWQDCCGWSRDWQLRMA